MDNFTVGEACISSVCYKEPGFMDYRFAACRAATELGFHVVRNPEDTGVTQNMFADTLKKEYPVFILVVGKVKSDVVMEECRLALEYGLPIFASMLKSGAHIPGEVRKIMKSISQFTYDSDCATFTTCEDLYDSLKVRLNKYIKDRITMRPYIQNNRGSTYYYAYAQIVRAKKRIILSQKTSSLLLGPRRGNQYEHRFYHALLDWIRNKTLDMQFLHLFNREDTMAGFSSSDYNINEARANLRSLIDGELKKANGCDHPNFTFRSIESDERNVAHIITDTGIQFVLPMAGETFNLVLPYYFATEGELMKLITHLNTLQYVPYSEIDRLYEDYSLH